MKQVTVYADGACDATEEHGKNARGNGKWAATLVYHSDEGDREKTIQGNVEDTTSNRMELTAVLEAFLLMTQPCEVRVVLDCDYILNVMNKGYSDVWLENGWKNAGGHPVKNQALWRKLLGLVKDHEVKWEWVSGPKDNEVNDQVTKLTEPTEMSDEPIQYGDLV